MTALWLLLLVASVAGAVSVDWALKCTITETLPSNTDSAPDATRKITHTAFNEAGTLTSATTPPVTKQASFVKALSTGSGTIDLTSLTGSNGATVDGTGLKVQILRVKNLGANNLVITPGASNGIDLFGSSSSVTVFPGACYQFFLNDSPPDIASGDRTIDLAGTGSQTSEWTIVMG